MKRLEVNVITGETTEVELTSAEQAQAQAQYEAWQIDEAIKLEKVAKEEARQVKFQEWLETQG
tara:strand:+ start:117 stop:305 length:189 start_codon:yes stop_codon:yes gene_type:complete